MYIHNIMYVSTYYVGTYYDMYALCSRKASVRLAKDKHNDQRPTNLSLSLHY